MLGISSVLRELQGIGRRLDRGMPLDTNESVLQTAVLPVPQRHEAAQAGGFLFGRDQPVAEQAEPEPHPVASSRSELPPIPEAIETPPAPKLRRNLMFSSTRRERERSRADDQSATPQTVAPPAIPELSEPPPGNQEGAWRKSERVRPSDSSSVRRGGRAPSTFSEPFTGAGESEDQPPVTVLKSGIVDGMAYSLYSDGSIEAQMPEGMMRFASIDELRAHLDQRP
jgi:hypothetical protein